MINIEAAVVDKFPAFANQPGLIRRPTISLLRRLIHEKEINAFLTQHAGCRDFQFIDEVLDYFDFNYTISSRDRKNIPAHGRVVIFANHPIGSLDGLAILRLISEVRPDVRIVANDMLGSVKAISNLIIPLDNMTGNSPRKAYKRVLEALNNEEAIIIFPAGEVSRARPTGVKDSRWLPGFLNFARKANAPLLPVRIHAKNSLLFYSASMMYKPLGTALLAREMFNKHNRSLHFSVGEPIPSEALRSDQVHDRTLVKRLKRHLYKLGKRQRHPIFETEKTIAHPEDPKAIHAELKQAALLGQTRDGNRIYLARCEQNSPLLREIGRLREIAFRKVGEGTGRASDLDEYDLNYLHLVLWNSENLEIAGAYRLGVGADLLTQQGESGFYTHSLYQFTPAFRHYLAQGVELGRSFVNPHYWGKASLDYLWQGLGAYLAQNPQIRYLIGPVSMSANYPRELMDTLAYFYRRYHACPEPLASAHQPYLLSAQRIAELDSEFGERDRDSAFDFMQQRFQEQGEKLPVLFKQYTALFEEGGFQSIVFSVDPDFGDCLDGLCMCDLHKLKTAKRKRYIPEQEKDAAEA